MCTGGMSLVEVVVGVSIITLVLALSIAGTSHFFSVGKKTVDRVAATYLAQEGVEAVRFMRDANWAQITALPVNTPQYIAVGTSTITSTTTPEIINGFARTLFIRDVYRATSGDDIVASTSAVGKALDPGTKLVEVTVSATNGSGVSVMLGAYLTNLRDE